MATTRITRALMSVFVLFVVVSMANPRFVSANNLTTIFSGNAYIAVAAIGMAMVIITGNIDVSVGALIGVLATISGTLAVSGYPVWVAWTLPILIGMAVNGVVGALVAYGRLPSIVVTLGMLDWQRPIYQAVFAPLASPETASLLYAVAYTLLMMLVAWVMYRRRVFIKV